jgi:hypothetical protein
MQGPRTRANVPPRLFAIVVVLVILICAFVPAQAMLMFLMMVISQDYSTKDSMLPETEIAVLTLPTSLNQEKCQWHYTASNEEDPFKRQRWLNIIIRGKYLRLAIANAALII